MLNGDDNENVFNTNRKVTHEGERVSRVNFLAGGNFHWFSAFIGAFVKLTSSNQHMAYIPGPESRPHLWETQVWMALPRYIWIPCFPIMMKSPVIPLGIQGQASYSTALHQLC